MPASLTCEQVEVWLEVDDPDNWAGVSSAWDVSKWDTPPDAIWAIGEQAGWHNATDHNRGFVIERGRQSAWDEMSAGTCDLELDNSDGTYSVYGDRSWPRIRPGLSVNIYANWEGVRYQLFTGNMTEWVEADVPNDYTVRVRAVDKFAMLAEQQPLEYHAGFDAQPAAWRIDQLLDRAGFKGKRDLAPGLATMTNYLTSRTILDEIEVTAMSDCGIFFIDNDGTAVYLDRDRYYGRPTAESMPVFGDSCDGTELPYASLQTVLGSKEFGNVITISNVSQGTDSPESGVAVNQSSIDLNGRFLWTTNQLVICNAQWVQGIATWQLSRRSDVLYRIDQFECYPIHDDRLWSALLPLRVGDRIKVIRRPPFSPPINGNMLVDGLRIEATPDLWKVTVRCSPGSIVDDIAFWDINAHWDADAWV